MSFQNKIGFDNSWNFKTISTFAILLALPNILGMLNISTPWGFKIHFFQIAIFVAAMAFGPFGGLISGAVGSIYSAVLMHNPYLIIGNMILGFFAGLFLRYGIKMIYAAMLAFLIQLPWLVSTDYYLVNMPMPFIIGLVFSLLASNLVWSVLAGYSSKPIKAYLK